MYVYPTEFESRGLLADAVTSYSIFGLFLFQILMFGFFSTIFGKELTWASLVLLFGEIVLVTMFKFINQSDMKYMHDDMDDFSDDEENLNNLSIDQEANDKSVPLLQYKYSKKKTKFMMSRIVSKMSDKHREILREAYLDPYQRHNVNETRQMNLD